MAASQGMTDRTAVPPAGPADATEVRPGRLALVERYFEACSRGSAETISACFTDDATIFDTNLPPVRGDVACGRFWTTVRSRWGGATWQVDHGIADGDDVACEWTMRGVADDGRPVTFRGSDHYRFEGDRIAEVRQYWVFDRGGLMSGLLDYPYGDPADRPADGDVPSLPSPGASRDPAPASSSS